MKSCSLVILLLFVAVSFGSRDLRSCDSCGSECQNACGTRGFKTCCFNYLKKRSLLSDENADPEIRLELIESSSIIGGGDRHVRSCDTCGMECKNACGTKGFRPCCLSYQKRSNNPSEPPLPLALDPSLRLELWLAKSRSALYQGNFETAYDSNDGSQDATNDTT